MRSLAERGDVAYLRAIYGRQDHRSLRDRVMRLVVEGGESRPWLRTIALDEREDLDLRDSAVRLLAQQGVPSTELATLYHRLTERNLRSRIIALLAERGDDAAWSKLEAISHGEGDPDLRRKATRSLSRS